MLRQFKNYLFGKLSGNAAQYYDGTGAFSVPAGSGNGGGLTLLEEHIASNSTELAFNTRNVGSFTGATFQSDFDDYIFRLINIIPVNNTVDLCMQISTNGGSSYLTTNYYYGGWYVGNTGLNGALGNGPVAEWHILNAMLNTTDGVSGQVNFPDPLNSPVRKTVYFDATGSDSGNHLRVSGFGTNLGTTAIDALRFFFGIGNIASGIIRVYGVQK